MGETDKGKAGAARQQRLSAAMRENLKRRKAQARGRAAADPKPDATAARNVSPRKGA
jgi:hypothetical protein